MLRLSDAIRLGAMLHPQWFGRMYERDSNYHVTHTCALGAAYVALGIAITGWERAPDEWSPILERSTMCPICRFHKEKFVDIVMDTIPHLNDHHRWSREAIADWVQTIETEMEAESGQMEAPTLAAAHGGR